MNYIISESQIKTLLEQSEKALEPLIARFFMFLNEEKKKHKTREELLSAIKRLLPFFNFPKGLELYLLELYLNNYREDGDYSNLTKDNFIDPRKLRGKRTTNTKADLYTVAKLPFRGANLEGFWTKDGKGVPYYVVKSYGWYPIYIFKNDVWYEVIERYSSATGRQMYNSNPVEYNDDLNSEVVLATRKEMELVERGATLDDIMKHKAEKLKEFEPELQKKRMSRAKEYGGWDDETDVRLPGYIVKFKVNSIEPGEDKSTVVIDVYDVKKNEGNREIPTPQNYLKGELPNITKERVENTIIRKLKYELKPYMGTRYGRWDDLPEGSKIRFRFNHLKK